MCGRLKDAFNNVDTAFRASPNSLSDQSVTALADRVLDLHQGLFLRDETEQACFIAFREHSRAKFLRYVVKLARYWEDSEQWENALDYYERALESDNLSEDSIATSCCAIRR